jgi:hypothetical protein
MGSVVTSLPLRLVFDIAAIRESQTGSLLF